MYGSYIHIFKKEVQMFVKATNCSCYTVTAVLLVFPHLLNCPNLPLTVEGKSYSCMYDGPAVVIILFYSLHKFPSIHLKMCSAD